MNKLICMGFSESADTKWLEHSERISIYVSCHKCGTSLKIRSKEREGMGFNFNVETEHECIEKV